MDPSVPRVKALLELVGDGGWTLHGSMAWRHLRAMGQRGPSENEAPRLKGGWFFQAHGRWMILVLLPMPRYAKPSALQSKGSECFGPSHLLKRAKYGGHVFAPNPGTRPRRPRRPSSLLARSRWMGRGFRLMGGPPQLVESMLGRISPGLSNGSESSSSRGRTRSRRFGRLLHDGQVISPGCELRLIVDDDKHARVPVLGL